MILCIVSAKMAMKYLSNFPMVFPDFRMIFVRGAYTKRYILSYNQYCSCNCHWLMCARKYSSNKWTASEEVMLGWGQAWTTNSDFISRLGQWHYISYPGIWEFRNKCREGANTIKKFRAEVQKPKFGPAANKYLFLFLGLPRNPTNVSDEFIQP